jgi:hypothetical protein
MVTACVYSSIAYPIIAQAVVGASEVGQVAALRVGSVIRFWMRVWSPIRVR